MTKMILKKLFVALEKNFLFWTVLQFIIILSKEKSAKYLQSLNVENITSGIANQSVIIYKVALCRFYDFYIDIAENSSRKT